MSNQAWQAVVDLLEDFLGVSWAPVEELTITLPAYADINNSSSANTIHREQLQEDLWISVHEPHDLVPFELHH